MYLDNREIRNQKDRSFLHEKLIQSGVNAQLVNLPLGDFLWIVQVSGFYF